MAHASLRTPLPLLAGFAAFLAVLIALVAASLARRQMPEFAPTPVGYRPARGPLEEDTVTVDARDPTAWQFFSLSRGLLPPRDTAGWDLAFRRFNVISSGTVAPAGAASFLELREPPDSGYVSTAMGRDTVNPAMARWYQYSFVTHLLHPLDRAYVLRTSAGPHVKLQFLGYYCPGTVPGCVTIRYALLPSHGVPGP